MSDEPENLVLQLLRDMRERMATKHDIARLDKKIDDLGVDLRSEMHSLRADVASDLHMLDAKIEASNKDLSEKIVGLRRAVMEYHSSAIGHGELFTELEERVRNAQQQYDERIRRIEQHLHLPPHDKH